VVQEPINQPAVLEFLLRNDDLPRSFSYALSSLRNSLRALPRHDRALREVNRLRRTLSQTAVGELSGDELREFIDSAQVQLGAIHDAINRVYFNFKPRRPRQDSSAAPKAKAKAKA
jgi:uncharacterized alpha-E superfamily protein